MHQAGTLNVIRPCTRRPVIVTPKEIHELYEQHELIRKYQQLPGIVGTQMVGGKQPIHHQHLQHQFGHHFVNPSMSSPHLNSSASIMSAPGSTQKQGAPCSPMNISRHHQNQLLTTQASLTTSIGGSQQGGNNWSKNNVTLMPGSVTGGASQSSDQFRKSLRVETSSHEREMGYACLVGQPAVTTAYPTTGDEELKQQYVQTRHYAGFQPVLQQQIVKPSMQQFVESPTGTGAADDFDEQQEKEFAPTNKFQPIYRRSAKPNYLQNIK
ncbi:hypothetical protein FGO68_gene1321 [Halteria grandinella]|uniref:Uncharacterized protein n=1 Tax=Halteria grandinella TaxID=5974 RepID=A0A8J8T5Z0_HALGN|nr:hypothetical protein FGO68_gene1321 [Halteria grandinella]